MANIYYEKAERFGLGSYFQPHMGNIIIADSEMDAATALKVAQYITAYPAYILGHEEDYYFITRLDELAADRYRL